MSVEIKLSRSNRIYRSNESVEGKIVTKLSSSISHQGIRLNVNASVNLQSIFRFEEDQPVSLNLFMALSSPYKYCKDSSNLLNLLFNPCFEPSRISVDYAAWTLRKCQRMHVGYFKVRNKTVEVLKSGRISSGTTEIPFSFKLKDPGEKPLEKFYETYHGGDISIQYLASVEISRGYLHKSLSATVEFIIETEKENLPEKPISPEMVIFYMTPDTQRHSLLPELKSGGFRVSAKVCTLCSLSDPIEGELTVESSAVPIQSIDIHLLRVESILVGEKIATESSLIQTTQIADGDVCRGMTLPIYIILPRLLTCPSILAGPFSIEFKVNLVITFQSEQSKVHSKSNFKSLKPWHAAESVPLELIRTK